MNIACAITWLCSFKTIGLRESRLAALGTLRFERSLATPEVEIKSILDMYYCGTRQYHPRTRIIRQKRGSAEFLTKLFRSEGGISLSHNNTYEGYFFSPTL